MLPKTAENVPCPACLSQEAHLALADLHPSLPHEHEYRWSICSTCRCHFAWPRKAMDYEEAYQSAETYAENTDSFAQAVRDTESSVNGACFNRSIAAKIIGNAPRGRHLDIGAGNGYLLEISRKAGHEVVGVDISSRSRELVRKNVKGAAVYASLDETPGRFSIISALEVVEHLEDPGALVALMWDRLEDDGILILSAPNADRPYWRYGANGEERKFWLRGGVGDTSPHHLTRFTQRAFARLLGRLGIGNFHIDYTPLDVVTWFLWDLGMPFSADFKLAGVRCQFPILWLQKHLMENVVLKHWRRDRSQGYGLMVVARKGESGTTELSEMFEEALQVAVKDHLTALDQDFLSRVSKHLQLSVPPLRSYLHHVRRWLK